MEDHAADFDRADSRDVEAVTPAPTPELLRFTTSQVRRGHSAVSSGKWTGHGPAYVHIEGVVGVEIVVGATSHRITSGDRSVPPRGR
jgi:hypothetical protein